MKNFLTTIRLAVTLDSSLRDDPYFCCYFSKGIRGRIARFLFFIDEINFRQRHGIVIDLGDCVALIGVPPFLFMNGRWMTKLTRLAIACQGIPFTTRWEKILSVHEECTEEYIYLSALACAKKSRNMGLGSKALDIVTAKARDINFDIECEVTSSYLCRWYGRKGFKITHREKLPDGQDIMKLKLELKQPSLEG